jgi:uncharacterized phiE125 gp8 family phage protein
MALKLITGPLLEPISKAEGKLHLKIEADQTDEDTLIDALIVAARQAAEHELGRSLMPQTWELALDEFPCEPVILCNGPVTAVSSVKYLDLAGVLQTLAPSAYVLDDYSAPARLTLAPASSWPSTQRRAGAVLIRYVAGYADAASVPAAVKQWMLLQIGAMYENREAEMLGNFQPVTLGFTDRLLDRYRVY